MYKKFQTERASESDYFHKFISTLKLYINMYKDRSCRLWKLLILLAFSLSSWDLHGPYISLVYVYTRYIKYQTVSLRPSLMSFAYKKAIKSLWELTKMPLCPVKMVEIFKHLKGSKYLYVCLWAFVLCLVSVPVDKQRSYIFCVNLICSYIYCVRPLDDVFEL